MDVTLLSTVIATFVVGLVAFRFAIPLAVKRDWVDVPNSRRRHAHPMPIIGGATVFATWFFGLVAYGLLKKDWVVHNQASLLPILTSVTMLLGLGL
ncbi:MAG: hypothetical protein HY075_15380, partial [Deltaproteobacteria bacterium]|nr:hypothetical protein [Deltaproteobacteria bacterium]